VKRLVLPSLLVAALAVPLPAQARPIEREHYSGTDSFNFSDCGFVIHDEVTFDGVFMLKAPKDPGAPPRLFDNYHNTETLTANGRSLTIEHQGLYKDLHVSRVSGTVYQFVSMESGQPFVVRDEAGNVMIRDRGVLRTTFRVDTQGDTDLDNDEFIEGSFQLLADHGRHPGYYFDFCGFMSDYFVG